MIDERDVHEMLHRRANAVPTPVVDAPKATRRARRRLFVTGTVAMFAVAAIALAGLAGIDEIRSAPVPADQPTPSVTPPTSQFTERFDSSLNGLSIDYPAGWRTRVATEPWRGKIAFDAPDVDVIFDPKFGKDLYLAMVSEPVGSKSPRDWVTDHIDSPSLGVCYAGGSGGMGNGFLGNPAWFQECHGPGSRGQILFFATASRGYIIFLHAANDRRLKATYNAHWFWGRDGVLKTVELPEDASDTSNPSASPYTGGQQ